MRSRSRSRSPRRGRSPRQQEQEETICLEPDEVAYILGANGSTKDRLSRFTECKLDVNEKEVILTGTLESREMARLAIDLTLQQRNRTMTVDFRSIEVGPFSVGGGRVVCRFVVACAPPSKKNSHPPPSVPWDTVASDLLTRRDSLIISRGGRRGLTSPSLMYRNLPLVLFSEAKVERE